MAKYYAVKKGRIPGVYHTWDECKKQVDGYSGAVYKSFSSLQEANDFLIEKSKTVFHNGLIAYVDGSYNIKTKEYGYGCVLIEGQKVIEKLSGKGNKEELASMRNVSGEILGSLAAMKYAVDHRYPQICIYYDYEGIEKWCIGEWKTNKEGTRAYREFYQEIEKKLQVKFIKVKGHSNDKYNDMADMLAKSALGIGDGRFVPGEGPLWLKKKDLQNN